MNPADCQRSQAKHAPKADPDLLKLGIGNAEAEIFALPVRAASRAKKIKSGEGYRANHIGLCPA
jgi:hypothetical protein